MVQLPNKKESYCELKLKPLMPYVMVILSKIVYLLNQIFSLILVKSFAGSSHLTDAAVMILKAKIGLSVHKNAIAWMGF